MQINILDAKNRLSDLLRLAAQGEDIVIAKRGHPVARLVAVQDPRLDDPGQLEGILSAINYHRQRLPNAAENGHVDEIVRGNRESWE
jgi:prevent-host-death family protein